MQPYHTSQRARRTALWAGMATLLLAVAPGCRKKPDVSQAGRAFRSDVQRKLVTTDDPHCPSPDRVESPGSSDPEFPVAEAYRAALMPDGEEALARFTKQFVQTKDTPFLIKHQWPRLRKHVDKYVREPDNFAFEICRREKKDEKTIKLFVRSHDPSKTHPPMAVERAGSGWKIAFFSY